MLSVQGREAAAFPSHRLCVLCVDGLGNYRYVLASIPVYIDCLTAPLDLHAAWLAKNGYFFGVLSLAIVSSQFYLLASLVDPGFLPKHVSNRCWQASRQSHSR